MKSLLFSKHLACLVLDSDGIVDCEGGETALIRQSIRGGGGDTGQWTSGFMVFLF